jgi:hypothetical protein
MNYQLGKAKYNIWIGMSAAELRAQGIEVDASVPDCALLGPREVEPNTNVETDGLNLLNVSWEIGLEWRWIKVEGTVTP